MSSLARLLGLLTRFPRYASRPFLGERTREADGKRGKYVFETYEKCYSDITRFVSLRELSR